MRAGKQNLVTERSDPFRTRSDPAGARKQKLWRLHTILWGFFTRDPAVIPQVKNKKKENRRPDASPTIAPRQDQT
jgi:hypothetical protein